MKKIKSHQPPKAFPLIRPTLEQLKLEAAGPRGRDKLRTRRQLCVLSRSDTDDFIERAKQTLANLEANKAYWDGLITDIDAILGEVAA